MLSLAMNTISCFPCNDKAQFIHFLETLPDNQSLNRHSFSILLSNKSAAPLKMVILAYNSNHHMQVFSICGFPATHETRVGSLGQEDPLEKERATHSSILAWEIIWIDELCLEGYSPWGNKKLGMTGRATLSLLSICTGTLCLPPTLLRKMLN